MHDDFGEEQLGVYISDQVPEMLIGDPGRFRQIITNLMGNSIKVSAGPQKISTFDSKLRLDNLPSQAKLQSSY